MPNTELKSNKIVLRKQVHVAVGVIVDSLGRILIARRAKGQHQGDLWEFPGGKVEPGETVLMALTRELCEELGIKAGASSPVTKISHDYGDKSVLLDVWRVESFSGVPSGVEGQPLKWVEPKDLGKFEFPAANYNIVAALTLPRLVAVTGDYISSSDFIQKLNQSILLGAQMVYLREAKVFDAGLFAEAVDRCAAAGVRAVTNRDDFARQFNIGLHLNSKRLELATAESLLEYKLIGAACHSRADLLKAQALDLNYAFLSPVHQTQTHPAAEALTLERFTRLISGLNLPVFGLGGVEIEDAEVFRQVGAQGIASIGAFWGGKEGAN